MADEDCKELLYLVQVADLKEIHVFGRGFQNSGNCFVIEQEMNPVHALGQEVFNLVQVRIADFKFFHNLRFELNGRTIKLKKTAGPLSVSH